ncbi:MAG: ABC transporter permease [Armatimonadota bacterium]
MKNSTWDGIWKQALFLAALLSIWETGSRLGVWSSALLPPPSIIGRSLWGLASDRTLLSSLAHSMQLMLIGYAAAVLIGIPLGIVINRIPWLRQTLGAALLGLQTLPSVCWVPIALLWFGAGTNAVLFVVLGNSVFAIATATTAALAQVPPLLVQAGQTLGAKGWRLILWVLLPAALPEIAGGMRIGWTFAWRALMAGELLSPNRGLGRLLQQGRERSDIAEILATMLVIITLGLLVELAVFSRVDHHLRRKWGLAQA